MIQKIRKSIILFLLVAIGAICGIIYFAINSENKIVTANAQIKVDMVEIGEEKSVLSELSEEECVEFLEQKGVEIPKEFRDEDLGKFVKKVIKRVEDDPSYDGSTISYWKTYDFTVEIINAVNDYYGDDRISVYLASSRYVLQDSTLYCSDGWLDYNCYAYAIERTENPPEYSTAKQYQPGDFSGILFELNGKTIAQIAAVVRNDLRALGYCDISLSTTLPSIRTDEKLICVRRGSDDYHFMRYDAETDAWYHKPGFSSILRYNYVPTNDRVWTNEAVQVTGTPDAPSITYTSEIYFITYSYVYSAGVVNDHVTIAGVKSNEEIPSFLAIPAKMTFGGIEYDVLTINSEAFCNTFELVELSLPNTLMNIGYKAFSGCTNLETVYLEDGGSLLGVASCAFEDCTDLTTISIPSTVTSMGAGVFEGCTGLTSVSLPFVGESATSTNCYLGYLFGAPNFSTQVQYIPQSLMTVTIASGTLISEYAFYGCSGITSVTLPSTLTSIGEYAFYGCGLTSLTLPASLQEVGICAFDENTGLSITWNYNGTNSLTAEKFAPYLTAVNIADGTQAIKANAFKNATKVTSVTLPDTLTTIGYSAFMNCSLTSVTIPSSVEVVGTDAFYGNTGLSITWNYGGGAMTAEAFGAYLTSVVFEPSATTIQREAFRRATGLTSLTIPNTITSIDRFAFYGCRNLTSLHISASVTEIGIGLTGACDNLVTLTVDEANPVYRSEGNCVIRRSDNALVAGCMGSDIPSSVLSIEGYAFGDLDELTSIEIGSSVEHIGQRAFTGTGLTSIRLPASMESLAQQAFEGCLSLETVYIDGYEVIDLEYVDGNGDFVSYTYPNSVFVYCDKLQFIYVPDTETLTAYRTDKYWSFFADLIFVENTSGPIGGGGSGIGGGSESGGENEGGDEEITEEIGGENMVVLVTDASATDSRVVWLNNYYQCDRVHANRGSYTAGEIGGLIEEYETSHFVFYAKTELFFNRLMYETLLGRYFACGNLLSAMVVTDDGVYKLYEETVTVKRDTYSMGFKIAKEFIYEDGENLVSATGSLLGYVPITAPAEYKNDLMFLMGLSDVFGYPVKIVTADTANDEETSELQEELRLLSEYELNPQTWLFVDVETTEWVSAFDEFGTEYGAFYFFNRNEAVLPMLQTLSTHVYLISDKARIPEDVLTVVVEGVDEDTAYTWVFQAWEAWGEQDLDLDELIWKREEYLQFWSGLGYSFSTATWENYWRFYYDVGWNWDYYQEAMDNTVYVEQNVTSYPVTEE